MNPHLTRSAIRNLYPALLLLLLIPFAHAQEPVVAEKPSGEPVLTDQQKRHKAFEIVWQTVNERFYDRNFGGVDWLQVRKRYEPLVAAATSDTQAHLLLQQMINELHQSHFVVIPPESIPRFVPPKKSDSQRHLGGDQEDEVSEDENADDTDLAMLLDKGNPELTEKLSTGIGIEVRIVDRAVVITRINRGSSAARAGLLPGFVIKKANSVLLDQAIARFESNPIWKDLLRSEMPRVVLAGFINGPADTMVRLSIIDRRNRHRTVVVKRERLPGEMTPGIGNLPPLYTEFESRVLRGGIGYIRFDAFVPAMMRKVCAALRSMHDAPALIIDLRGNQGGLLGMLSGLSGLLETKLIALGAMQTRSGSSPLYAFPQRDPYLGGIAILIDGSTESAAEMFASALQENGRAVIVGERSAGNTLPSAIIKLPTGALFQYGWANFQTTAGKTLEGNGVVPDVSVKLRRQQLLAGVDPQLAGAIVQAREQVKLNRVLATVNIIGEKNPNEISPRAPGVNPTKTDSAPPPPPPKADAPPAASAKPENKLPSDLPSAEEIVQRFLEVSGGEEVLRKISSRISTGSIEVPLTGLRGNVEIYELAPNKKSIIVNIRGYGVFQRTWDGTKGWVQDPLQGYIDLGSSAIARVNTEADLLSLLTLRQSGAALRLMGKLKVNDRDVFVVQATYPGPVRKVWYFDTENGLLLRKDNVYYEDYRAVDGLKLPFTIRDESFSGFAAVMKLDTIKQNVAVDEAKFREYPSCFTKPVQN
jgi:carboxyl-terminal processing protease